METLEASVLAADYVLEDGPVVRLFCVTCRGETVVARHEGFHPYFYVVPVDSAAAEVEIENEEFETNDGPVSVMSVEHEREMDGSEEVEVLKVVLERPPDIPKVRERVAAMESVRETREFDIPFYKRYLIDNGIKPGGTVEMEGEVDRSGRMLAVELAAAPGPVDASREPSFSTLAFDLEVYGDEVIMCSFCSHGFRKVLVQEVEGHGFSSDHVEVVDGEKQLLERLIEVVDGEDPDILLGYNTDEFDFDVLRSRAEEHGVALELGRTGERMKFRRRGRFSGAKLEGRVHLDLYAFVENLVSMGMKSDTLTLDSVAEELIGENKEQLSWEEMKSSWEEREELDRFARYALRDSELVHSLGETLVPQILSLSRITGLPPFDVCRHTYGQLVENYLLRKAHERDIIAPNRPSQEERGRRYGEGRYAGGFVYEPEEGLHEDIALFDFRSLYPTIIVSHNISPETLEVGGCSDELEVDIEEGGERYRFCQDSPGFIPSLLEDLVEGRYQLKSEMDALGSGSQEYRDMDNRQNAQKILSNAFYGYMGYNGARWYSRPCAEATTALGRQYIQKTIEKAEGMGFDVVYGDTDSIMIKGGDVKERLEDFQVKVNSELPEFMELEFEGFFPRGLFTYTENGGGAKKKYALIDPEGKVRITGFEQVRRDWSSVAKEVQEEVISKVLEGDVDSAVKTVEETIEKLKEGNVPLEQLRIYTQMKKKPENYEAKTPHSEAAKRAIKRGEEISPGETIAYVITSGEGAISDRAELLKYAEDYDPDYYIENQVVPVALRVLKVLGYTEDQLLGKGRQSGLDQFS